ncbi:unnamed protein product [Rotaria magnacalcarata]|nr:unnamed protein product [Rotaria magnacalcarata]CAF2134763.1 unnamed protein product [Rotaria magnacalcarata]
MPSASFSVLPIIGNDHHPILWHPSFKFSSNHQRRPINRTRWNLFEIFLTFTAAYWQPLVDSMSYSAKFFSIYERFLSLGVARGTLINFCSEIKPSLLCCDLTGCDKNNKQAVISSQKKVMTELS